MERIDASETGIFEISWSPSGEWLTYVSGDNEVRLANAVGDKIRVIGNGCSPSLTGDNDVVFERDEKIIMATSGGEKTIVSKKDIVKETPKQGPLVSPDSKRVLFHVSNIIDKESQQKNAYPYRHFIALTQLKSKRHLLTEEQWYGGTAVWFPSGSHFAHFEFDSTGGPQIHIVDKDGKREGTVAGLYPSVSPDGTTIAARPRAGGSLVIYTSKGSWNDQDIQTAVMRIPGGAAEHKSANPAVWIDNRFALIDEGEKLWRIDTKRDKAEEMKKLPIPTMRRTRSMVPSPDRTKIATEVETEKGFELRIASMK